MRANMVGAVIILSLFLWIPASCLVCYVVCSIDHLYMKCRPWVQILPFQA